MSNSRTKPVTREARVKIDTTEADLRRLTVCECSAHAPLTRKAMAAAGVDAQIKADAHPAEPKTRCRSARMPGSPDIILRH